VETELVIMGILAWIHRWMPWQFSNSPPSSQRVAERAGQRRGGQQKDSMTHENQSKNQRPAFAALAGYALAKALREDADDCPRPDRALLMRRAAEEIECLIVEAREKAHTVKLTDGGSAK
jgi:hypothetical protein